MNTHTCSTEREAIAWVKKQRKDIKEKFASKTIYPSVENPFSIFMAGAPGVGKTEFSKSFLKAYYEVGDVAPVIRVDTDEIREIIPGYNGTNAPIFQRAAALGIEYIFDTAQDRSQNIFVDTTFGNPSKAISNIKRAINRKRNVGIFYLYQDPLASWEYTKKREKLEGRIVPKEFFVESFFMSRKNVNEVKNLFGNNVKLTLLVVDKDHTLLLSKFNIENVDPYVKVHYTREELMEKLS